MEASNKETVLTLLFLEAMRRLSKNGKSKVVITNEQLNRLVEKNLEVDYSESNENRFILKLVEGEDIMNFIEVKEGVELED